MGWNTSALFIRGRSVDDVLGFLPDVFSYQPTGEVVTSEEAMAGHPGGRLYLAGGDWCQLWDPDARFAPRTDRMIEQDGPRILTGTRALAVLFSSVTSTYGFWLYDDGALIRRVEYASGGVVDSAGSRLPVEAGITFPSWGPDEDFVWDVIEGVTGSACDPEQRYTVFTVA